MQKLEIFFGPCVVRSPLLDDWLRDRGYHATWVDDLSDPKLLQGWRSMVKASAPAFFIDYPIDSNFQFEAIESFLSHVLASGGAWYYAPRPNEYLDVDHVSMVGMAIAQPLRSPSWKEWLKPYAKRTIDGLPSRWRKSVRKLAMRAYSNKSVTNFSPSEINAEGVSITNRSFSPNVKLPTPLLRYAIGWNNWQAPQAVLESDLLDRVSHFFPHPNHIHVIVLNQCNLKCVMCPYHSPVYKPHQVSGYFDERKSLSVDSFRRVAEYAGARKISLQFGQIEEVLMHKRFFDLLDLTKEYGVPMVHVTTNGVLLDQAKAERLAASGVTSVMFSIDSVNPDTYRAIRGSDLAQLEENIKYFIPLAKRAGISVSASFILQPQADGERDAFLEKWRKLGMDQVTFYVLTENDLKTGEMIRKGGEMYDKGQRYPCASPWTQAVLFPEGEVSLCCKTMSDVGWRGVVSLGELDKQSLDEVWHGADYRQVRKELLGNSFKQFPVCAKCEIWSASTSLVETRETFTRSFNETMETYDFR